MLGRADVIYSPAVSFLSDEHTRIPVLVKLPHLCCNTRIPVTIPLPAVPVKLPRVCCHTRIPVTHQQSCTHRLLC